MYATLEDLVDCFGPREIAKRADADYGLIGDYNNPDFTIPQIRTRIEKVLKAACAMVNFKLGCCFEISCIKDMIDEGHTFCILEHWTVHIARYLLHKDLSLKNCGNIVVDNYIDVCNQIDKACDCACLTSDQGKECPKKCQSFMAVGCRTPCLPDPCKHCCDDPCCCEHKMGGKAW